MTRQPADSAWPASVVASLVLPTPPSPVRKTVSPSPRPALCSSSASAASSRSRPTSGSGASGRLLPDVVGSLEGMRGGGGGDVRRECSPRRASRQAATGLPARLLLVYGRDQ